MRISTYTQALLAAAVLCAGAVHATPVTWTLQNVTFSDGATASGWFNYDADTHLSTAFNLVTTDTVLLGGYTYSLATSAQTVNPFNPTGPTWRSNDFTPYLSLTTVTPFTNAGGTLTLAQSSYECDNCQTIRTLVSGSLSSAVPEPASGGLMLLGAGLLGLLGLFGRRRSA